MLISVPSNPRTRVRKNLGDDFIEEAENNKETQKKMKPTVILTGWSGFSLGRLHMGEFVPLPPIWGASAGGQSVNGETHEGHRPYGGPNFDRLYHKQQVLLLLSCNAIYRLRFY